MKAIDMKYLSVPLPEEMEKRKWGGDFDGLRKAIDLRLAENPPEALANRLMIEKNSLLILEREYPLTRKEVLEEMKSLIADFTEEEFQGMEDRGELDWIYRNGEKRYFGALCRSLLKGSPQLARRGALIKGRDFGLPQDTVRKMKEKGRLTCHIHLRHTLEIHKEAVQADQPIRVHIPLPVDQEPQWDLKILKISPTCGQAAPGDALQRTVCFETLLQPEEDRRFTVEYSYNITMPYVDLSLPPISGRSASTEDREALAPYLKEQLPHIRFSPFMRSLAEEMAGEETDKLRVARRCYDYVTTRITYAYVREYAAMDSIAEYCALRGRGDCGVQSLLFINLCRLCGIPAVWQSGLGSEPGDVGNHDWARFYIEGYGWLWADCSFGGSAFRQGNEELWHFYFGNLEPWRTIFNNDYQKDFTVPKKGMRLDPYDNQNGEAEYEDGGLRADQFTYTREEIAIRMVEEEKLEGFGKNKDYFC